MDECALCGSKRMLFFLHVEGKRICLACGDAAGIIQCDHYPNPCNDGSWMVDR